MYIHLTDYDYLTLSLVYKMFINDSTHENGKTKSMEKIIIRLFFIQ